MMATTVTAWTATHTGLPSFHIASDTPVTVTCPGRTVARLAAGQHLLSDPLADPGASTDYVIAGQSYSVERPGGLAADAVFTDARGRGVTGLVYQADSDPIDFRPSVSQFNRAVARWGTQTPPRTGRGVLVLADPERETEVWDLCQARSRVVLSPAHATADDPLRVVVITSVRRSRTQAAGWLAFEISWSEIDPAPAPAPVVTWGEWAALGRGWEAKSALDLAREIAGMP